jgi:hypothetical protein
MSLSSLQLDQSGEFDLLYNFFYVRDYTGAETYESYALPFTPLTFAPNLEDGIADFISNKRVVWDFGDGSTTAETVTAQHAYDKPGRYKVTCYLYDENGTGYFDTFHSKVEIKDFIEDKLIIDSPTDIVHNTGEIINPITIERYNSFRVGTPTIVAYASGATDNDLFSKGYADQTYGHLNPSSSFVQILTSNNIVETLDTDVVTTENKDIYIKLDANNEIVYTDKNDTDAFFAGLTGTSEVYFRSDFVGTYNLLFGFQVGSIFDNTNTTTYGAKASIKENNTYNNLTITSNGIDGEGADGNTIFDIGDTKFASSKIAFVVKVKDDRNNTQKNMPLLSTTNASLDLYLTDGTTVYDADIVSNFQELSTLDKGGFYKGYFTTDNHTTLENVYLSAYSEITDSSDPFHTGVSNTFTIYPSSFYTVAKQGEQIDFKDAFKEIAVQPLFTDARVLMSDFIGSIFGDLSATQDSIGKSTYEKIQNFFDNNTSVDESNIDQLDGILQLLDLPGINKYSLPPKLTRVMNLLSISRSKLFGRRNRDNTHYQSYGYRFNNFYGENLGEALSAGSKIVVGQKIVAHEKYSGDYITLNTSLPVSAAAIPAIETTTGFIYVTTSGQLLSAESVELDEGIELEQEQLPNCDIITENGLQIITDALSSNSAFYSLSDYNSTWGWPLLTGGGRDVTDIYNFYYQKETEGNIHDSIIDWTDPNTTISYTMTSYEDWSKNNGTMSNIFAQSLYEGLELFED